jgi:hypothetical protein
MARRRGQQWRDVSQLSRFREFALSSLFSFDRRQRKFGLNVSLAVAVLALRRSAIARSTAKRAVASTKGM